MLVWNADIRNKHTFLLTGEEQEAFWQLQGAHSCKPGGEECCYPDLVTPSCLTGSESAHQPHYTGRRRIAFRKSAWLNA